MHLQVNIAYKSRNLGWNLRVRTLHSACLTARYVVCATAATSAGRLQKVGQSPSSGTLQHKIVQEARCVLSDPLTTETTVELVSPNVSSYPAGKKLL
jgi:hypothetical protein